ncbi:hypothetical protein ACI703_07995 [Isoptericola jiangsuensis]|uniref:hypothetical protein n=1 Tax=Isoptericola jiangsuensis TaxID=548579 RepID=UPI00386D008F
MSNELSKSDGGNQLTGVGSGSSLTRELVSQMTPEQRQKYAGKALETLIERESSDEEMRRRHAAANVGIARDIETARELGRGKEDFSLTSTHRTASGETKVTVTKGSNKLMLVGMIVIAIIFFVLFSR